MTGTIRVGFPLAVWIYCDDGTFLDPGSHVEENAENDNYQKVVIYPPVM